MKPIVLVVAASMFLHGCASKPPATPDWVAGESAQYKKAQYLIGRGQASGQEEAKDRARADLAKIFQVAIVAESDDIQKYKSDAGGEQYESQVMRRTSTQTSQIIRGIQLAELWQDPADRNYHALAILPRQQTAASLRQQISQLDEDTGNHIERSQKSEDLFLKIAAANQAVESQQERESMQKMLQVVDITGRGVEPRWSSETLRAGLDGLLKRVRIASQVANDATPGLADVVSGALAKAGFMIETGEKPDFVLRSQLKLDDLGMKDGWYWQRGVLEVTLSEASTGRVRGTRRWNIKGNASDRQSAAKRTLNQADAVLKQELRGAIIDMANSR